MNNLLFVLEELENRLILRGKRLKKQKTNEIQDGEINEIQDGEINVITERKTLKK